MQDVRRASEGSDESELSDMSDGHSKVSEGYIMRLNKLLIAVLILQHKPLSTLSVLRDTLNVTISGYQLLLSICH